MNIYYMLGMYISRLADSPEIKEEEYTISNTDDKGSLPKNIFCLKTERPLTELIDIIGRDSFVENGILIFDRTEVDTDEKEKEMHRKLRHSPIFILLG